MQRSVGAAHSPSPLQATPQTEFSEPPAPPAPPTPTELVTAELESVVAAEPPAPPVEPELADVLLADVLELLVVHQLDRR